MRERFCAAPSHETNCPCVSCRKESCKGCPLITEDHFTPKCILKAWHIKDKIEGHQWLSKPCHRQKDHDTALRANVLKFQLRGGDLTFEAHRRLFKKQ